MRGGKWEKEVENGRKKGRDRKKGRRMEEVDEEEEMEY